MHRSTLLLCFGLSVGLLAGGPSRALAQAARQNGKSERVRFETVDQVELHGTYWPSSKGRKAPCAILLHKLGGKSLEDGWSQLAADLQKKGFAVLTFDFRGHGGSTSVNDGFWNYPYNRAGVRFRGRPPSTISQADFTRTYWPNLVNDIAAARLFLERKNDSGELNIANLVLIGAEDGATLGALWLASECHRFRLLPPVGFGGRPRPAPRPESKDIIACVWLSLSPTLGTQGRSYHAGSAVRDWLQKAGRLEKIAMAFVYGKTDSSGDRSALSYLNAIKPRYRRPTGDSRPAANDELPATGDWGVPGSQLKGSKLLAKSLPTSKWITDTYLDRTVLERFGNNEWQKRETDKDPFVWVFPRRLPIRAKGIGEKNLQPIPVQFLGLR